MHPLSDLKVLTSESGLQLAKDGCATDGRLTLDRKGIERSMDGSSDRSPLSKVYYRPIEAAIRWTRLWKHEREILEKLQNRSLPNPGEFPGWRALRLNSERIYDALRNDELSYGLNGVSAPPETPIDHPSLTVRHVHLKAWMQRYYPEQRPSFLFSALERSVHPAITIDDVRALTFERDSLKSLVVERDAEISALRVELRALLKSVDTGARHHSKASEATSRPGALDDALTPRAETTHLHIIGGLVSLMLGRSPSGQPYSSFHTQESIVSAMIAHCGELMGISERTLHAKFAAARRKLSGH